MVNKIFSRLGLTQEAKVSRIREHASNHISTLDGNLDGQKATALVVVHPYFPFFDGSGKEDLSSEEHELEELITAYEQSGTKHGKHEAERFRHFLDYLKDPTKLETYVRRMEHTLSNIDRSRVRTVLAEDPNHYWKRSYELVEQGLFGLVIVTDGRTGDVAGSDMATFQELADKTLKAYVAGSYAFQCPAGFSLHLQQHGVKVVPVRDILFDRYSPPEDWLTSIWEKEYHIKNASKLAVNSSQLPLLK